MRNKPTTFPCIKVNSQACIILGMGPQALFLLRIYRGFYKRIFLLGKNNWIGRLSRYGKKIVCSENHMKENVERLIEHFGEEVPILISGGYYLNYYLENEFLHSLNCYPKPISALKLLNNKRLFSRFVKENAFSLKTIPIRQFTEIKPEVFPVILKWNSDNERKSFKTIVIYDEEEYTKYFQQFVNISKDLITQPYLVSKKSISWGAYCENGQVSKQVVVNQVRQYPRGLTNCVTRYDGRHKALIEKECSKIAEFFDYSGFLELEFIEEKENHELYILEANPRPWGWIDFIKFYDKNRKTMPMVNMGRDFIDIKRRKKFYPLRKLPLRLIRYLRYNKTYWEWNDPLPMIGQVLNYISKNKE